jgi:hypothetical protein
MPMEWMNECMIEFFTYWYHTVRLPFPSSSLFLPQSFVVRDLDCRKSFTAMNTDGKWQWLLRAPCFNGAAIPDGCVSLRFHCPWVEKGLWISNASDVYGEYAQYESTRHAFKMKLWRFIVPGVYLRVCHERFHTSRFTLGDVWSWCCVVK